MIDTIVLTLKTGMFVIEKPEMFTPSARWILNSNSSIFDRKNYFISKQNGTQKELKLGIYKPRLTITKRFINGLPQIIMKIEFSAPKMLFKNNFDEIEESNFDLLISSLLQKLETMGVRTNAFYLKNALISSIHYSKNIALVNGSTSFSILKEIQKTNMSIRLDFNQTDFRNGGHSIKFRANSFEITFYDKMKDMQKSRISEKRAIENDNVIQKSLFEQLEESQRKKPLEVIRMEIRLNQRQKIRQILNHINFDIEPTLFNLFKKEIAQKVLLYYLDQIESNYPQTLFLNSNSAKDFLSQFIINNSTKKIKDAILAYGFHNILKELDMREIRGLFKRTSLSSWYHFYKQMNSYNYSKSKESVFEPIRKSINDFIPLKTVDYIL